MIAVLVLWLILILYGLRANKEVGDPLELKQTISLRGICAIEIMIGHIGWITGNEILYANRKAGLLFVGIFFMLSGYGIAYSIGHKEEYLKGFIGNRCLKLLLPAFLTYFLYEIVVIFLFHENEWFVLFQPMKFVQMTNWYVWEQLGLYLVFWMLYKVIPRRTNFMLMVLSVIFIVIAYVLDINNPIYGSTLCFVLGLYYYQYKDALEESFMEHSTYWLIVVGIILVGAIGCFVLLGNRSMIGNPIARNVAAISFSLLLIILLYKIKIGNSISVFLGECSYEIFLVHPFVLAIFKRLNFSSLVLYSFACIIISIVFARVIHLTTAKIYQIRK